MIVAKVGWYAFVVHLASAASFRGAALASQSSGGAGAVVGGGSVHGRLLQTPCSSAEKKNQCNDPCVWAGGVCTVRLKWQEACSLL